MKKKAKTKIEKPTIEETPNKEVFKSGSCIICNDAVISEPPVYDHPCHSECATASGDALIKRRIKELQNG